MPGISLVSSLNLPRQKTIDSFDLLKHRSKFNIDRLIDSSKTAAVFCGYEGYPVHKIEKSDRLIVVEGLVYNFTDDELDKRLLEIADRFRTNDDYLQSVREFMTAADGDFLVLIIDMRHHPLLHLVSNIRSIRFRAYSLN